MKKALTSAMLALCLAVHAFPQNNSPISFDGVSNITGYNISDTHGAVGMNNIVSIGNLGVRIMDKAGNNLLTEPDSVFFSSLKSYGLPKRDGRIEYDPMSHRWVFIILYAPPTVTKPLGFFIAVSQTEDAMGGWKMWAIPTDAIDFPMLGFNRNFICIGNNLSSELYVFPKSPLYNSTQVPSFKIFNNVTGIWQPCETLDSLQDNLYLVKTHVGNNGTIGLCKITASENLVYFADAVAPYTWSSPSTLNFSQEGTSLTVSPGGKDAMMNAVYINGSLWCVNGISLSNPNRASVAWWQINPESSAIINYGKVQDAAGNNNYCSPSIAVSNQGKALIGFAIFNKNNYPSWGYYYYDAGVDTVVNYFGGSGYFKNATWGDYSQSCIDPADGSLWTVQEYANSKNDWQTRWLHYPSPAKLLPFYADADHDGYGNRNSSVQAYSAPAGYVSDSTDCNDNNVNIHPGATETCNGMDDNCNGQIDEGVTSTFYADADGDGYGTSTSSVQACWAPAGYVSNNTDCNDNNSAIHPGATETCNGIDDNCNNQVDEGLAQFTIYRDLDGDGYGTSTNSVQACSISIGYVLDNADCNDSNLNIHPGATEVCNGLDDNCNGQIDEGVKSIFYIDADGDNYGNATISVQACSAPEGYVSDSTDCDDSDQFIHPEEVEFCNGIDDNCDGLIDNSVTYQNWFIDADNDGYGDPSDTGIYICENPGSGFSLNNTDCDDHDSNINPGTPEVCNGIDDNCNGEIDEGSILTFYLDADADGYGTSTSSVQGCSAPSGYVLNGSDCNDTNSSINPGATEICNNIDDNCDGQIDENVKSTFYVDADGDGYGASTNPVQACSAPIGYVSNTTDCNDNNIAVHPGATETCNGIDDNCDGQVDEGVKITFYQDGDKDGYGTSTSSVQACSAPNGYVTNNTDCNDNNVAIHPGAAETCNGIDDNCDGQIDEGVKTTFYLDADGDGYGTPTSSVQACSAPNGYVPNNLDCNDNSFSIHPGVTDVCNGIDDDCNGIVDDHAMNATVSPNGTVNVCSGTTVKFTANSGSGVTYQWLKAGKNISGATASTYSTKTAAVYSVKESNNYSCNSTSASVTLNENPIPNATITALGNLNICQTGSVVLQANSGSGFKYQWIKGSNNIAGATMQTYSATVAATYKVAVTNNSSCSKTSAGAKVTKSCREENNEGSLTHLSLYPNPTDGKFVVDLILNDEAANEVRIHVIDLIGQIVYNQTVSISNGDLKKEISLSNSNASGIYLVKVIANDREYVGRIVIQK